MSNNTINSYILSVKLFYSKFQKVTAKNLMSYKGFLTENYKPKTVNLRIQAINCYLNFIGKPDMKIKSNRSHFLRMS